MGRSEKAIITALCMIYEDDKILLQDRVKDDWRGYTLPGGHVEKEESIVCAVIREMREETGLTIRNPKLCGVKQFQTDDDERYIVFLFKTDEFEGDICASEEGEVHWISRDQLSQCALVNDFMELLQVFDSDSLTEFMYERKGEDDWLVKLY